MATPTPAIFATRPVLVKCGNCSTKTMTVKHTKDQVRECFERMYASTASVRVKGPVMVTVTDGVALDDRVVYKTSSGRHYAGIVSGLDLNIDHEGDVVPLHGLDRILVDVRGCTEEIFPRQVVKVARAK